MRAHEAFERFIACRPARVLDIGSGDGKHAAAMRYAGLNVTTVDIAPGADYCGDFMHVKITDLFDAVWLSHVLEHVSNVGLFLDRIRSCLLPDGLFAVTVPPMRTRLVDGHVNQFTPGSLLYNLILAGFDCRNARVGVYGYNVSVLVRRIDAALPNDLTMNSGDLARLAAFFPMRVVQGMDGNIGNIRW